jgi:hypothetical protein
MQFLYNIHNFCIVTTTSEKEFLMKKVSILVALVLLFAGAFVIAEENILIDFTLLDAVADDQGNLGENEHTTLDFSPAAPAGYTDEQKALLKSSLAIHNWDAVLNSSAVSRDSLLFNMVRQVPTTENSAIDYFASKSIMGVRVLFPTTPSAASVKIVPPFEIPAYGARVDEEDPNGPTQFEGGYGVVKNVGTIKTISARVFGNMFPYKLYVLLKDNNGVERRYLMGSLQFDGWKDLRWNNPNYTTNVRNRTLTQTPKYPNAETPYVKFAGFQIVRDGGQAGGDFISYFGDVRIIYDKAVLEEDRGIYPTEDGVWGIISGREAKKQQLEALNFGSKQLLQLSEKEKIAVEEDFGQQSAAEEAQ